MESTSSILKKLNNHAIAKSSKSLNDFESGDIFTIDMLKKVNTKYGSKLVAVTKDYEIFLPAKMASIPDEEMESYNSIKPLYMFYDGKIGNGHIIRFKDVLMPRRVPFTYNSEDSSFEPSQLLGSNI